MLVKTQCLDVLTGREHLQLYAGLRGISDASALITDLLEGLRLEAVADKVLLSKMFLIASPRVHTAAATSDA